MTYHIDTRDFECNGCGRREPEPASEFFTDRGEYRKPSPLKDWFHLSRMRANDHLLHFCGIMCVGLWASTRVDLTARAHVAGQLPMVAVDPTYLCKPVLGDESAPEAEAAS